MLLGTGPGAQGIRFSANGNLMYYTTNISSPLTSDENLTVVFNADGGQVTGAVYTNGVLSMNGNWATNYFSWLGDDGDRSDFRGWVYEIGVITNRILLASEIANIQTYSSATYTNPTVSPPWAPGGVPGLVLWWNLTNSILIKNAAGGNTTAASGDYVWLVRDIASRKSFSANGSYDTPADGPAYFSSGGKNNLPFLGFTNKHMLVCQHDATEIWNQPNWVFAVLKAKAGSDKLLMDGNTVTSQRHNISIHWSTGWGAYAGAGLSGSLTWPYVGTHALVSVLFNGANSEIRTNTISCIVGDTGAQNFRMNCVMDGYGGGYLLDGDLDELLIYNSALTSNQVWLVSNYLTNKYTLP